MVLYYFKHLNLPHTAGMKQGETQMFKFLIYFISGGNF